MAGKKKSKGKKKTKERHKAADSELSSMGAELQADTKSTMFGAELGFDSKLVHMEEDDKDEMGAYYQKMVLKCMKCDNRFDHEASLSPIEYELTCPSCNVSHLLKFRPKSRLFTVHSETIDVVDSEA